MENGFFNSSVLLGASAAALLSLNLFGAAKVKIPLIEAAYETEAIPYGQSDSDDSAIWVSKKDPSKSLILGTSKYDEDEMLGGGLGVYSLEGKERQFLGKAKLNNVDVSYDFPFQEGKADIAVASNRSTNALNIYRISSKGKVKLAAEGGLRDESSAVLEPYGLCLGGQNKDGGLSVFLPNKNGVVYHYLIYPEKLSNPYLLARYDLASEVSAEQDNLIKSLVRKEAEAEGDLDDLPESLAERFALEGCVFDPERERLYVGMENLGVWAVDTREQSSKLLLQVGGSWTDIASWSASGPSPRWTDDIEGMDILRGKKSSYLVFSSQGISEFSIFDLKAEKWVGNFRLALDDKDPVTATDGLSLVTDPLGKKFSAGLMVVHDDENTDKSGKQINANYKIISLKAVFKEFSDL